MSLEEEILSKYKTIAVVGLSSNPERPSHRVARYLKEQGYRIIPVNPRGREVMGEKSYPDLCAVPEPIDVVDIFREPKAVPRVVARPCTWRPRPSGCRRGSSTRWRQPAPAGPVWPW
jgi:predicted CoA-binding protein